MSIPEDVLAEAEVVIAARARGLVGHYGWTNEDVEDLKQEMLLAVCENWHRYDPSRGAPMALVHCVVDSAIKDQIDKRSAECRDWRVVVESLNDTYTDEEGNEVQRWNQLGNDCHDGRLGIVTEPEDVANARNVEVRDVLAGLDDELRDVADLVPVFGVTETSRRLGLSRSTVYARLELIRRAFAVRGIDYDDVA